MFSILLGWERIRDVPFRAGQRVLMVLVEFRGMSTSLSSRGVMCRPSVGDMGRYENGVSIASQLTREMHV